MADHNKQFLERHRDLIKQRPFCGCDVGPGWIPLLELLVQELKEQGWDGDLRQAKEKFGGLRFYIGKGSDAIFQLIDAAERGSLKICEICGKAGSPRGGNWIKTLCDEHAAGREKCNSWREMVDQSMSALQSSSSGSLGPMTSLGDVGSPVTGSMYHAALCGACQAGNHPECSGWCFCGCGNG